MDDRIEALDHASRWLFATTTVGLALVAATLWTLRNPVEPVGQPAPAVEPRPAPAPIS